MSNSIPFVIGRLGLLIFSLACAQANAEPQQAMWSPAHVDAVVYAGEEVTVSVSVEPATSSDSLSVWVVPELQPYVSVTPVAISGVAAGTEYTIQLRIRADATAEPHSVDGSIHLRDGTRTIARPLPVTLDVQWRSISGPGGAIVTYPGTVYATTSDETGAVLLWDIDADEPIPSSDTLGFISIAYLPNPEGQPIYEFFDGDPGDDIGDIRGTIEVDGRTGFEYRPIATLGGDRVVVVPISSGFVQLNEIGSDFSNDGPFQQVLESVRLPD